MNPRLERFWLLAALAPPLLVQAVWLWHNTALPGADAVEQLSSSYKLYLLAHEGRLKFFAKLLGQRFDQWRPTCYYLMQVPFQLLSGGNLMVAAAGATLLGTALSCYYVWRLLRLVLDAKSATLATIALGLLPIVQWPAARLGFSEGAFLPAVLAALYYLIRSDYGRDKRGSICFVIAAVAAFAVRPVEAGMHFALLFAVWLWMGWRKGIFSGAEIYRIALGGFVCGSGLALAGLWRFAVIDADPARGAVFGLIAKATLISTLIMLCGSLLWLMFSSPRKGEVGRVTVEARSRQNSPHPNPPPIGEGINYAVRSFTALYALIVLLYAPAISKLVEWVYMCSLGPLAQQTRRAPLYPIAGGMALAGSIGMLPFLSILALGLFSLALCLNKEQRRMFFASPLLYALTLVPPTLFMMMHSIQSDLRKGSVIYTLVLMLLLAAALLPGKFRRMRIGLAALVACLQYASGLWLAIAHAAPPWVTLISGDASSRPPMVTLAPNPNEIITALLKQSATTHGFKRIALPIDTDGDIDPFQLGLLAEVDGNPAKLHYPYIAAFGGVQDFLGGADDAFLLIHDTPGAFRVSPDETRRLRAERDAADNPNTKLLFALAALYAQGSPAIAKTDCVTLAFSSKEACVFAIQK